MNPKKIIIIGGGGHTKVLIDSILSSNIYKIEGILEPELEVGKRILGIPVLGPDEFLEYNKTAKDDFCLAIGIGTIRATDKRKMIYERYRRRGFEFPLIIHNKAYVAKSAECGVGVQIMAGAIVQSDVKIGENVIINTSAIVEHDCKIASHCHLSSSSALGGKVEVGECSHIGMGARVLQEIKIGSFATIGAGAVVTKDVREGVTVMGIPAREING